MNVKEWRWRRMGAFKDIDVTVVNGIWVAEEPRLLRLVATRPGGGGPRSDNVPELVGGRGGTFERCVRDVNGTGRMSGKCAHICASIASEDGTNDS